VARADGKGGFVEKCIIKLLCWTSGRRVNSDADRKLNVMVQHETNVSN